MRYITFSTIIFICSILLYSGCEVPSDPKIDDTTDPNPTGKQAAIIESISPEAAFPGEELTIYGSGFDPVAVNNMVAFGNKVAAVLSASENELIVRAPDIINEVVMVRVAVKGSEFWSNKFEYVFWDVVTLITEEIADPTGAEMDDEFNTYVSSKIDRAVYKLAMDGTVTVFADDIPVNGALKFGPGGSLFVAATDGLTKIAQEGSAKESVVSLANVVDFDWDETGNLYLLVANGLYRYDTNGNLSARLTNNSGANGIRIYDGHIYVTEQFLSRVQRYAITEEGVQAVDLPFRYTSALAGIEIDENGKLYIGAWFRTYLIAGTSVEDYEELFLDELPTNIGRLNYFGKSILAVKTGASGQVYRLYTGINGAPKYGR